MSHCLHDYRRLKAALTIRCRACGHVLEWEPQQAGFYQFAKQVGYATPVSLYAHRLKCRACGANDAEIAPPAPRISR